MSSRSCSVQVFQTEAGRWSVKSDAPGANVVDYASQGDAIAAAVRMAMAEGALLTIHAAEDARSEIDFAGCCAPQGCLKVA
ncbi:hypothetical protein LMG31506_03635 [Cupriavidus yeoncheonensis]|uniref:DUF2188 domain-containing protein n=1 Tax=Cupriavidus yeoncheonensis TaxID=1462994 RepID=A0A916NEJ9_9BURK|nr:DUF2188 domain-containing protein [Cupriavidus yeoncheonensis]CAG2147465.1 hypothetical protein LMG31506_03635 [Cupriavidus yeoncheonensis]